MEVTARRMPTAWFAEGRDPWRDLYTPPVISLIGQKVGITDPKKLDKLGVYLCHTVAPYLMLMPHGADDAGIELKPRQRAKWIDQHLIKPAWILIKALDRANDQHLREWPHTELEWIDQPLPPPPSWRPSWEKRGKKVRRSGKSLRELGHLGNYRAIWLSELNRLVEWAEAKKATVSQREAGTRKSRTKLRGELAYDLLLLYVTLFPDRKPTRASYAPFKRLAQESVIHNEFVDFVRAAARPVLGRFEKLDNQIQKAIERHKDEKTELWMRGLFFHLKAMA